MVVTLGLVLTAIGIFGRLRFPTRVPVVQYDMVRYAGNDHLTLVVELNERRKWLTDSESPRRMF